MAPWDQEQKEKWWTEFHDGKGSVVQRVRTKSGRCLSTFVTPTGERFDSWKKAQSYIRMHRQVVKEEADGDQPANLAKPPLSKKYGNSRLHRNDRKQFREWFWRKKGGLVRRKEYADKNLPSGGRWETKYVVPEGRKIFRSWKECVKFLGTDPEPSMTTWALQKHDEDGLPPIEVIPRSTTTKKMRGQLTSPVPISAAGAPTSNSATNPTEVDNVASVNPLGPRTLFESKYVGHLKSLLQESTDSSTEERLTLRSKRGLGGENGSGYGNLGLKRRSRKFSIGNGDLERKSTEEKEEKLKSGKATTVQSFVAEENNTVNSWDGKKKEPPNAKTGRRRRRVLILNSTSEETNEAKDIADGDISKDECHLTEYPQVMKQMSARSLKAAQPGGRLRISSVSKETSIHSSEKKDHNKKLQMNHSQKNIVTFYEERNGGSKEEGESVVKFDDETLQKSLINLLYADHIKQPTKHRNRKVIGMLYAEFIERSFAGNQNSNSGLLTLPTTGSKGRSQSFTSFKAQRLKCTVEKRNNPKPDRRSVRIRKMTKLRGKGEVRQPSN